MKTTKLYITILFACFLSNGFSQNISYTEKAEILKTAIDSVLRVSPTKEIIDIIASREEYKSSLKTIMDMYPDYKNENKDSIINFLWRNYQTGLPNICRIKS